MVSFWVLIASPSVQRWPRDAQQSLRDPTPSFLRLLVSTLAALGITTVQLEFNEWIKKIEAHKRSFFDPYVIKDYIAEECKLYSPSRREPTESKNQQKTSLGRVVAREEPHRKPQRQRLNGAPCCSHPPEIDTIA